MPQPPLTMKPGANAKPLHKHQPELPSPSQEALSQAHGALSQLLPILQAVAHRHRNQHSSSHWWRSFGLLRRAARSLAPALLRRPRRSDDAPPAIAHAEWMAEHVVPRAYIAFTQLAADNQHTPLGLMLLAVLARTNRIISDLVPSNHAAPEPDPTPAGSIDLTSTPDPDLTATAGPSQNDVDMGVIISRGDAALLKTKRRAPDSSEIQEFIPKELRKKKHIKLSNDAVEEMSKKPVKDALQAGKEKKKKKKKKGDDTLSSIFNGL